MDMFPSYSRWVNPTDKVVKLDVCHKANGEAGDGRIKIEILPRGSELPPGQKRGVHELDAKGLVVCASLPAELDAAIHIVRDGVIVGGLAPQLRKLLDDGEDQPTLAPELDPLESAKKAELEKATIALAQRAAAETQLITSAAKVAEASDQQQAQAAAAAAAEKSRLDAEAAKVQADRDRAEAEQLLADARAQKAEAEKVSKAAAKAKAEAEKAKAEADAAMAAATDPKAPAPAAGGSGGGDDSGNGGKRGGKAS